jgi:tripartite-type tricarboxylate transporter receptor subunit TctC
LLLPYSTARRKASSTKLNATIARIVTLPDVKKQFEEQGTEAAGSTQAEMAKMLREDYAQFGESAKRIGVAVD